MKFKYNYVYNKKIFKKCFEGLFIKQLMQPLSTRKKELSTGYTQFIHYCTALEQLNVKIL